jgi:hypothetical protein
VTVDVPPFGTTLPLALTPYPLIATSCGRIERFFITIVTSPAFALSDFVEYFIDAPGAVEILSTVFWAAPCAGSAVRASAATAAATRTRIIGLLSRVDEPDSSRGPASNLDQS